MALPIDCTVFLEPVLSYGILHSDASHCPDSCINMVLTCATPSVGRTICAMERPCFGSTLRTASIIAVKSAYLRESFPFSPMAAVAFFSAGSSSPCAAARAFASSLICSLWVSHIYLLPAFFRFRERRHLLPALQAQVRQGREAHATLLASSFSIHRPTTSASETCPARISS